jgi:subtilisin family serine protease
MRLGGRDRAANSREPVQREVAAVLALVGGSSRPAPPTRPVAAENAWVVAQTDDGHLQVVTGDAADQLVDRAASGAPGPEVLSVDTDQPVHALDAGENDPLRSQQWALDRVPFEGAWNVTRGRGVIVAIVDSGVEANHQDLAGSVLRASTT